jgi:hypothetical protein
LREFFRDDDDSDDDLEDNIDDILVDTLEEVESKCYFTRTTNRAPKPNLINEDLDTGEFASLSASELKQKYSMSRESFHAIVPLIKTTKCSGQTETTLMAIRSLHRKCSY